MSLPNGGKTATVRFQALDAKEAKMPKTKSSALVDTRVIYCGDNLDQLKKLPPACVELDELHE